VVDPARPFTSAFRRAIFTIAVGILKAAIREVTAVQRCAINIFYSTSEDEGFLSVVVHNNIQK
jgi:hypothetical protein